MVSYAKGLYTWYPILAQAIILPLLYRRSVFIVTVNLITVIVIGAMYGFWNDWQLGASFGHRGFVEIVPLVAVSFAYGIDQTRFKIGVGVVAAALSLICVVLMLAYWRGAVPHAGAVSEQYWKALMMGHLSRKEIIALSLAMFAFAAAALVPLLVRRAEGRSRTSRPTALFR
jgi:hypothetical protein